MRKTTKRLFALLLVLTMVVSLLPTIAFARFDGEADPTEPVYVYTEEDNALIENDVFAKIENVKAEAAAKLGGVGKMTEQNYKDLVPQVVKAIEARQHFRVHFRDP